MKKKMTIALLSIVTFIFAIQSVNATEYKYESWTSGSGYGTATKIDDNTTNLKGNETASGGMFVGPYSKASTAKLKDKISEELYVGLDFNKIKEGEFFEVSLALKNGGNDYVSEAVVMTQRVGDKIKLTTGWAPDFEANITTQGIYTYHFDMWIEGNKTYVSFTLLQANRELATTGKIDFDTIITADTKNPIAEQTDVSVKYLWFCNIKVEAGVDVYTKLPTVKLTLVSPFEDEEDEVFDVVKYASFTQEEVDLLKEEIKTLAKEEGYTFDGFYGDEKLTTEFDLTKPFIEDVKVYLKINKIVEETKKEEVKNPKTGDMNLTLVLIPLAAATISAYAISRKKLARVSK